MKVLSVHTALRAALAATIIVLSGAAQATVITFDGQPTGSVPAAFDDTGYHFVFANISGGFAEFGHPASCTPACSSDGTQAYYSFNAASLTMSEVGGGAFSLLSLDLAQTFTTLSRDATLNVTGTLSGGGSVSTTLTLGAGSADTFHTLALPNTFTNLSSVTFVGGASYPESEFALDNLTVDSVPEPITISLVAFTLVGLGFDRHRRFR